MGNSFSGLYAVTDPRWLLENEFTSKIEQACLAGVKVIQYRNKQGTPQEKEYQAKQAQEICQHYQVIFLINDDVNLAVKAQADGVHLGQSDTALTKAKQKLADNKIIGITCHADTNLAIKAQSQGATYVSFGRFFPSQTKPQASQSPLSLLTEARSKISCPIVAIGGVTANNGAQLIEAGADMLAASAAIFKSQNIEQQVKQFISLWNK